MAFCLDGYIIQFRKRKPWCNDSTTKQVGDNALKNYGVDVLALTGAPETEQTSGCFKLA